ncbi:hypothetical protein DAQ1742_03793 [Dickeya aquatica]|uniref:Uncharacterized protein n=1 Tax=Dickeya aquatica TaxID=1401087 RepID=A0A375AF87_9GAMM|nr:hypothetical protein DAQ1742_03793 [Dickeya aquatica]
MIFYAFFGFFYSFRHGLNGSALPDFGFKKVKTNRGWEW